MKIFRSKIFSPRGRSMSISPEPGRNRESPDYKHRSKSRSPNHKRHNGYGRSNFHKKNRKYNPSFSKILEQKSPLVML